MNNNILYKLYTPLATPTSLHFSSPNPFKSSAEMSSYIKVFFPQSIELKRTNEFPMNSENKPPYV